MAVTFCRKTLAALRLADVPEFARQLPAHLANKAEGEVIPVLFARFHKPEIPLSSQSKDFVPHHQLPIMIRKQPQNPTHYLELRAQLPDLTPVVTTLTFMALDHDEGAWYAFPEPFVREGKTYINLVKLY